MSLISTGTLFDAQAAGVWADFEKKKYVQRTQLPRKCPTLHPLIGKLPIRVLLHNLTCFRLPILWSKVDQNAPLRYAAAGSSFCL